MSENTDSAFNVTVLPTKADNSAELKDVSVEVINSDSSNIPVTANGTNVSFVNITYTIQPHPIKSLFKKYPSKTILDNVRWV